MTDGLFHTNTCDIPKPFLGLDPDLCQNFLFFISLSMLNIQTYMIHQRKPVLKGFILFLTPKSFEQYMGTL